MVLPRLSSCTIGWLLASAFALEGATGAFLIALRAPGAITAFMVTIGSALAPGAFVVLFNWLLLNRYSTTPPSSRIEHAGWLTFLTLMCVGVALAATLLARSFSA